MRHIYNYLGGTKMAGINVNGIGRNPYADSYLTTAKNRSNTTSKDTFVNAVKKVEEFLTKDI